MDRKGEEADGAGGSPKKAWICAECGEEFSSTSKSNLSVLMALSNHLDMHLMIDTFVQVYVECRKREIF